MRTAVDLPLPLAPMRATHCPGAIVSEKSRSGLERAERAVELACLQGRRIVHQRSAAGQAIR